MTIAEPLCTRFPGNLEQTKPPVYTGMPIDITGSSEPYLTLREIAQRFHCKERTVREWTERYDDFPGIRLPGEWRVRESDFLVWTRRFQEVK
jgi:hypothetical protein